MGSLCPNPIQSRDRAGKSEEVKVGDARDRGVRWMRGCVGVANKEDPRRYWSKGPAQGEAGRFQHTPEAEMESFGPRNQVAAAERPHVREYHRSEKLDALAHTCRSVRAPRNLRFTTGMFCTAALIQVLNFLPLGLMFQCFRQFVVGRLDVL